MSSLIVCVISVDLVVISCSCQSDFLSVDHLAASAAHVVHYAIVLAYAGAKYWLILVLVLAISSDIFGLPGFLPVLMNVSVGLVDTREASLLAVRFFLHLDCEECKQRNAMHPIFFVPVEYVLVLELVGVLADILAPVRASHDSMWSSENSWLCL